MTNIVRSSVFGSHLPVPPVSLPASPRDAVEKPVGDSASPRHPAAVRWLVNDIPYLAMLALAAVGVVLRLPVSYWVVITPAFAAISVFEGWRQFANKREQIGFVIRLCIDWCAVLLAIYFLYNSGVAGVMNANATSLAMMVLLALGTFVTGVQARVWQICAVGGILFLTVPGLGWLDQSPLLLLAGACAAVVVASLGWWFTQQGRRKVGNDGLTSKPSR